MIKMAKLHFRYGAMNSGKSTALMQVAHNYEELNYKVLVMKSSLDTKGENYLVSRIGAKRKIDHYIYPNSFVPELIKEDLEQGIKCILIDEAQFLKEKQVEELYIISKEYDIPVICYGLRTNFRSETFEGSKRLIELADEMEELITICPCGKKARFNARKVNGSFTRTGNTIEIDGANETVEYLPLCGDCYIKLVGLSDENVEEINTKKQKQKVKK